MTPSDAAAIGFRHFHDQLAHLKQRLLDMSDLATSLLDLSVDALLSRDSAMADAVINADSDLDALELEVEDKAIALLANPDASSLDFQRINLSRQIADAALSPDGKTLAVIARAGGRPSSHRSLIGDGIDRSIHRGYREP